MVTEYLLNQEVEHVLAALMPSNRLACRVMLHTGLRLGDVLDLEAERIGPRFWVTERKTGKRRMVGLTMPLVRALKANSGGGRWCFPHRFDVDKHRTRQAVYYDVKRAAAAFRLPQNVAPHSFRKVYAVTLLDRYGDIDRVRRALNHGSLTTTMIYAMSDKLLRRRLRGRKNMD